MLYRYRLYLEDGSSEASEAHYAARIKAASPALCAESGGRNVRRVADDDVVFVFGSERVSLSHEEAKTLYDDWIRWDAAVGARLSLRGPLRYAVDDGGDVVVPDNAMREVLLEILDVMDKADAITTDALRRLHEVARLPITGG